MKKKILIIFIISLLLFACKSKMENPLMGFKLGEDELSWKKKIKQNQIDGLLSMPNKDSTINRYYFKKGKEKIFSDIDINSDGYSYGNLRIIKFHLGSDTINLFGTNEFRRTAGSRAKKDIDKLFNWFVELYGKPNDTISSSFFNSISSKTKNPEDKFLDLFDVKPEDGAYIWHRDNYQIEFSKDLSFSFNSDSTKYRHPHVIFRLNSYEKEIKKVAEDVRKKMKPNDVARAELRDPWWEKLYPANYWDYDYRFKITISNVYRIGKEEPRNMIAVQFDIVFTDIFETEISRINDVKLELSRPIEMEKGPFVKLNDYSYMLTFTTLFTFNLAGNSFSP